MRQAFDPHRYAMTLSHGGYASDRYRLFRWTGTFWQALEESDARCEAYRWLVRHDRPHASDTCAVAAFRAALLWVDALPSPAEGFIVPCRNGYVVLDADTPVLTPPEPRFGVQHVLNCAYLPAAEAPRFAQFLHEVLPDAAVRGRVQEYVGYTLLHDARYQRAQFWLGSGANGKGVLANIVQALHGQAASIALDALSGFRVSALLGASLICCDEAPRGGFDEQLLKSMIAGEVILVDRKFRDPLVTRILGKWLVLGNHLPAVKDHSSGFWRRWDFVPFSCTIPEARRDPLLAQHIRNTELPGVLNWALAGLQRLLARGGFDPVLPPAMAALLREVKRDTNSVQAWFEEGDIRFDAVPDTPKDDVYANYRAWCERNGLAPSAAPRFWTRLRDLGEVLECRKRTFDGQVRCCNVGLEAE